MSKSTPLRSEWVGQRACAYAAFGDLTVLAGSQATGKSVFLPFLKLAWDTRYVHNQRRMHAIDWKRHVGDVIKKVKWLKDWLRTSAPALSGMTRGTYGYV